MNIWRHAENHAITQIERRAGNTTLNRNFHNCRSETATRGPLTSPFVAHPEGRTQGVCLCQPVIAAGLLAASRGAP
jgi:hypothetical protein